jgi:hypothetical protein
MSNYVKATNFAVKDGLATGNPAKIIKGTEIDTEYNAIASAISSKADLNSPAFTGTPAGPTASAGASTTQLATTAFVAAAIAAAAIPTGMIMIWSGSVATIPTGWVLCNGSNSTPDLRDKFVIGAGNSYAVNGTGGSKDAIVVSHTHTLSATTSSAGSHSHLTGTSTQLNPFGVSVARYGYADTWTNVAGANGGAAGYDTNTSTVAAHTHTVSGTTDSTGSSGTNANLPPYYALCYIMKT